MEEAQRGPIIAKIQWKNQEYYVRQKRITIGRHSSKGEVDVDLGDSNFISRVHLEIVYEEPDFLLKCNGKNGIFVDDDFQRPSDGLQILPSKCLIGFPSTGMFLVFCSLVEEPAARQPCLLPPASATGLAPSPAGTLSACSSRPVSPARPGEVTIISSANGSNATSGDTDLSIIGGSAPLLHHGYSSGSAERQVPTQEALAEDVDGEQDRTKPPFSYAQLIVQAVSSARDRQLTLSGIYSYITRHYPYYRTADKGWQNSIRHNLSLNRSFIKVARGQEQPGKGSFWRVEPHSEARLMEQAFRSRPSGRRRAGPGGGREQNGTSDMCPDSPSQWTPDGATPPSHWTHDGATPPYLTSRESSPAPGPTSAPMLAPASSTSHSVAPAAGSYNSGVAATVIVAPGRSGDVARARLVPLSSASADSLVTSHLSGDDVIIAPSDITFLSDECLITTEASDSEVAIVSSSTGPAGGGAPLQQQRQRPPAAGRC